MKHLKLGECKLLLKSSFSLLPWGKWGDGLCITVQFLPLHLLQSLSRGNRVFSIN